MKMRICRNYTDSKNESATIYDCMIESHNYEQSGLTIEAQFIVKNKGSIIAQTCTMKLAEAIAQDYIRR